MATFTKYRIREATTDDAETILAMAIEFAGTTKYGALFPLDHEKLLEVVYSLITEQGVVLLCDVVEDNVVKPAGMLALVVLPHPFSSTVYAEELVWWIAPAQRAGRLGIRLLDSAERWAATCNKTVSMLKMSAPTDDVGRFLQRRGYEAVETHWIKRITR